MLRVLKEGLGAVEEQLFRRELNYECDDDDVTAIFCKFLHLVRPNKFNTIPFSMQCIDVFFSSMVLVRQ